FSSRAIRVVRVSDEKSLEEWAHTPARAILLDTFHPDLQGGSGVSFDWELAFRAKEYGRIILAGGLTPENVGEAVTRVAPYGVDVSSGVEMRKGKKDLTRLREFISSAKMAGGRLASPR